MLNRLSHFIIGYMALAFSWWAYHLWSQNDILFETQRQLLSCRKEHSIASGITQDAADLTLEGCRKKWEGRRRMIIAESAFFMLCLGIGLYRINRSVMKEVSLTRQRRNFMLSITHELKSPIAGIRLILETAEKRVLTRTQTEQLCQTGLRDTARLQGLVEDLLLAARLEDNWKPYPETIDLKHITDEIVAGLKTRFPAANINTDFSADLPPLQADKPAMISVIQNLLENAIKYSPEGAPVSLVIHHGNGRYTIKVVDCGKGISDREKAAVFHKFYRIGNEETRSATGTGLGLYIVKQVVKAHNGTIQLTDNQPNGSVFTVVIF